jgi:hypothetical protein
MKGSAQTGSCHFTDFRYEDNHSSIKTSGIKTGLSQNSNLLIPIPDLKPDFYHIELITQYTSKDIPLNEPRSATLGSMLRVVQR